MSDGFPLIHILFFAVLAAVFAVDEVSVSVSRARSPLAFVAAPLADVEGAKWEGDDVCGGPPAAPAAGAGARCPGLVGAVLAAEPGWHCRPRPAPGPCRGPRLVQAVPATERRRLCGRTAGAAAHAYRRLACISHWLPSWNDALDEVARGICFARI
mmetsp:Transcript_118386/g.377357  ORF Transcript_118386/g.377357 Transcript_118386/m.377357 type:complete len:156 (-) Transcript_118386:48-515(-)